MTAVPNPLDSLTRAELLYLVKAQIWLRADISWARYLAASAAAFEAWRKLSAEEESVAPARPTGSGRSKAERIMAARHAARARTEDAWARYEAASRRKDRLYAAHREGAEF